MVTQPLRASSKDIDWHLLAREDVIVEVAGELRLTVAVSVGEKTDGEEEGFATGVNKVGDIVGAEVMMLAL